MNLKDTEGSYIPKYTIFKSILVNLIITQQFMVVLFIFKEQTSKYSIQVSHKIKPRKMEGSFMLSKFKISQLKMFKL